jgi:predicted kinase
VKVKTEELKTKTTKETQFLKVTLTQDELLEAADELATALDNLNKLTDEKEAVGKGFKAREAALEAEITKQQLLVRNKYEHRNVDCENVLDYDTLETYTTRLDTGEEIMRRKMTEDEKQTDLPFDED